MGLVFLAVFFATGSFLGAPPTSMPFFNFELLLSRNKLLLINFQLLVNFNCQFQLLVNFQFAKS